MKTLKVLGIIGLVWFGISFMCLAGFNNQYDYESAIGWGILAVFYGVALSIVAIIKSKQHGI